MIKYPVRVVPDPLAVNVGQDEWGPGFIVKDADDFTVAEQELEEDANTIANALNAMNEVPDISAMLSAGYTNDNFVTIEELISNDITEWYKKFIKE